MGKSVRDLLDDIRDVEYGPKMAALPEKERKFVSIVLMQASTNFAAAAEEAGFDAPDEFKKDGSPNFRLAGWRLQHKKRIQEAMREETHRRIEVGAVIGVAGLVKMATDPTHPKHFQACESLADRGGYSKEHRLNVSHTHTDLTGEALMARIRELAKKHGLDAERLLRGERPARSAESAKEVEPIFKMAMNKQVVRDREAEAARDAAADAPIYREADPVTIDGTAHEIPGE